ncbi:MAG: hypothetical protein KC656_27110, partial [Myxococcales bacterium]|nr:hypothetical protein [Myxococcales bacterium]
FAAGFAFAGGGSLIPEVGGTPAPKPVQAPPGRVDLTDAETADAMVTALVADGTRGTEKLAEIALEHRDLAARGRAIVGLARAEGSKADTTLEKLRNSGSDEQLVRTWAYAASLQRAPDLSTVLALASEQGRYTGSERAVQLAAGRYLQDASAVELLEMAGSVPALNAAIGPMLLEVPPAELGALMLTHPNDNVRRQAAAWLGSQATQKGRTDAVARITIDQLRHDPGVGDVPWKGGALYIPGIQWDQKRARELVRTLIQWKLYCERTGKSGEKNQVWNNLRSVQLLQAAGFQNAWPNDEQVLEEWARIGGKGDVEKLRGEQGWE